MKTDYPDEFHGKLDIYLSKWKRRTTVLGIALLASIASVIPFLDGYPLHGEFTNTGKYLIYLSMGLLILFLGSAALTYNSWAYRRSLRSNNDNPQTR